MENLTLKIPSEKENVRVVESFIENARTKYNINEDVYGNIMVAVTESVSNAIIHGNKQDKNKCVNLALNIQNSQLCIEISDEGMGYDIDKVPDPTAPENLTKPEGRGIFLMRNLCDKVAFLERGKRVQLFFNV